MGTFAAKEEIASIPEHYYLCFIKHSIFKSVTSLANQISDVPQYK